MMLAKSGCLFVEKCEQRSNRRGRPSGAVQGDVGAARWVWSCWRYVSPVPKTLEDSVWAHPSADGEESHRELAPSTPPLDESSSKDGPDNSTGSLIGVGSC
jgi:hypothetical protein